MEAAATHFDNLVDRQENGTFVPALQTWADFVAEFSKTFGIFDIARDAQTRLDWVKQQPFETFAAFIIRFEESAFKTGYNDAALVSKLRSAVLQGLDSTIAAQETQPVTYAEWVSRYQRVDSAVRATQDAHKRGGNQNVGPYGILAVGPTQAKVQPANWNNKNWQGGAQNRGQGWNNRQRGAAAFEGGQTNVDLSTFDFQQSITNLNESTQSSQYDCTCGTKADFEGEAFLRAGITRTPEQEEEFQQRRREKRCFRCGGQDHRVRDCKNPESLETTKENVSNSATKASEDRDRLRAAVFTLESAQDESGEWSVQILEQNEDSFESGKAQGVSMNL